MKKTSQLYLFILLVIMVLAFAYLIKKSNNPHEAQNTNGTQLMNSTSNIPGIKPRDARYWEKVK